MKLVHIDMASQWSFFLSDEGHWVGNCDELGLTVQSSTCEELTEDIRTTLALMLEDLRETGELDNFAEAHGWGISETDLGRAKPTDAPSLRVPFTALLAERTDESQEAVLA